jgi:coenzyme F420-reducing hydrogenase beta subunit
MVMGLLGFYARPSFSFSDDFHPALFGGITLKHGYGRWSGRGKLYTGMVFFLMRLAGVHFTLPGGYEVMIVRITHSSFSRALRSGSVVVWILDSLLESQWTDGDF